MNETRSALIIIDMEKGFVSPDSPFCIVNAEKTVKNCTKVIDKARTLDIPIFFVKRLYRGNGSDVEITRYQKWKQKGMAMQPSSTGNSSAEAYPGLAPKEGDYTIIKPRWSAFFATDLDLLLRRLDVDTIILMGTTTPNCIRTTAYDGNALDYEVVVIEDGCSSQTAEIQKANMDDMERMGAVIMDSESFCHHYSGVEPNKLEIRENIIQTTVVPETFEQTSGYMIKRDIW
ncbi:MAG: cysteine hydrolase [Lachnospiraceae bacterium]|nr:cysteine hydrolase [Lachnospiraceae bacterium]